MAETKNTTTSVELPPDLSPLVVEAISNPDVLRDPIFEIPSRSGDAVRWRVDWRGLWLADKVHKKKITLAHLLSGLSIERLVDMIWIGALYYDALLTRDQVEAWIVSGALDTEGVWAKMIVVVARLISGEDVEAEDEDGEDAPGKGEGVSMEMVREFLQS